MKSPRLAFHIIANGLVKIYEQTVGNCFYYCAHTSKLFNIFPSVHVGKRCGKHALIFTVFYFLHVGAIYTTFENRFQSASI